MIRKQTNPVARDLRSPKYKQRIVRDKSKYNRKDKSNVRIDRNTRTSSDEV